MEDSRALLAGLGAENHSSRENYMDSYIVNDGVHPLTHPRPAILEPGHL